VANTLKGFTQNWLFAMEEMLDWSADQLTWMNLKPRFQNQFAPKTDDKLIIYSLSNLAISLNETTGELLARITNTMVIFKESYAAYEKKGKAPPQDRHRGVGYLDATATKWKNDAVSNMLNLFKMQLFRATPPRDLQKAVAQHNQNTITLDNMYQVATDTQRESGAKASQPMAAVNEDSHSEAKDDEDEVATFQNRRNNRFQTTPTRHLSAAIILTQVPEATQTGLANTVSTVKSRRSAGKESKRINCVKTNKDMPTGQKGM
jgi:hypothetical protein